MKQFDYVLANEKPEVLNFLKSQYPLYHLSNIFFRDVQYGIQTMLDRKNTSVGYADAEMIAKAFVAQLEKKKILNPIDKQSWVMNYPDFKKPAAKPVAAAKPAAKPAAPAAAAPGTTKPSLPPLSRPAAGAGKLPPLSRPAVATATPALAPTATPQQAEVPAVAETPAVTEAPKAAAVPSPAPAPKAVPPGERKPLPPLRSSAGKK